VKFEKLFSTYKQIFICFSLPWLLFFLLLSLGKEVYFFWGEDVLLQRLVQYPKQNWFWCNFLPSILLFFIGFFINYFIGYKKQIETSIILTAAIVLIIIDQAIQFLIKIYYDSINISLVEGWIEIIPKSVVHYNGTYLSNAQKPIPVHLLICFLGIVIGYFLIRFLCFFIKNRNLLKISASLYAAGLFCSISNAIFYKYGYDYIELYPLCIFDIKDIYILVGFSTLLLFLIQNKNYLKKTTLKNVKKYFKWEYALWRTKFFNNKQRKIKREYLD
jgi:lipoprotein signal peptidase